MIALAKAKPGELTFSSAGSGGAPHLAGELFKSLTGTELLHVPYRGSGPAVIDLIAGRITMMFDATPSLLPNITAGKLRPLAAASPQRHRLLPDVPSFAELGYPGMDIALWYGVVAPGGTPAPIVQRLNAELAKIVDMPDIRKSLTEQGADVQGGTRGRLRRVHAQRVRALGRGGEAGRDQAGMTANRASPSSRKATTAGRCFVTPPDRSDDRPTVRPGAISFSAGRSVRQRAKACGQRGWKWQPGGGSIGEGISPLIGREALLARVEPRHVGEQRLRVGMVRARRTAPRSARPRRRGRDT